MKNTGRIYLIDDDELILSLLARSLEKDGYEIRSQTNAANALNNIESWYPDVVLLDVDLPDRSGIEVLRDIKENGLGTQVVMLTADDTAETAIKAMKIGAADYLSKPFNMENVKIVIQKIIEQEKLKDQVDYLKKVRGQLFEEEIIGNSPAMADLKSKAEKLAKARVRTILITGESGTGKEVVAKYIHQLMHVCKGLECTPFIPINCTALPEHLFESELFGHVKGAFTDASSDKKGIFELANGGSILLDEIGDMKHDLQSKLLRVLEERNIRRVGGKGDIPVDVTVLATTNADLSSAVDKGEFRMDLFHRLNTFALVIPPLRDRSEDIPLLARHFLAIFAKKYKKAAIKSFSPEAEATLCAYNWPGNIRELKNVVERIVVLEETETVTREHITSLPTHKKFADRRKAARFLLPSEGISLEDLEKDLIGQALEKAGHNQTQAAKLLNLSYDALRYQMKKFGIK